MFLTYITHCHTPRDSAGRPGPREAAAYLAQRMATRNAVPLAGGKGDAMK